MSSSLNEQLKLHTEDRDSWDNIMPMEDWTLEEYQKLYKMISSGFLLNHPEYTGAFIVKDEESESCDNGVCHGGRGWRTDESVAIDETKMFCCGECGDEWVSKQDEE